MKKHFDKTSLSHILAVFAKKLAFIIPGILLFIIMQSYIPRNVSYEYTNTKKSTSVDEHAKPVTGTLCTLRLEEGKLGIYKSDGSLESVVEISPELLTEYDKELLSKGICADRRELSELIGELLS